MADMEPTTNTKYAKSVTVQEYFTEGLNKTIGINWRRLRNEHGFSLHQLCSKAGISHAVAADIEACRHRSINLDDCRRAADAYGMSLGEFMREITKGTTSEDPVPYRDITTADVREVYPYNIIYRINGEVPDPVKINLKGFNDALGTLYEMERTALLLRFRMNKSLKETAEEMNTTTERVRMLEARALRKLRRPGFVRAIENPSFIQEVKPFEDDPNGYIVLEKDYVVNILYKDLAEECKYVSGGEISGKTAEKAISRVTGLVFSNFVLLQNQKSEDCARSREILVDENRQRISILNMVCNGEYADAFTALRNWLENKETYDYLAYDEAQFLSMLHVVMNGNCSSMHGAQRHRTDGTYRPREGNYDPTEGSETNTDIQELQVSHRTLGIIKRLGCFDTDDIARKGRREFSKARGCGSKSMQELSKVMEMCGYDW
ncbi:MAG: helix-turn-helix domain-containing protein [Mogibacterium sp.]|nr:helix-turn-helix domain-containing protein [Mogibacterium sp.]